MIRFHLDENVNDAVAAALKRRDIDVTTTADAGLIGAEDTAHLAFALADGRVVVTHDDDFLRLADAGVPHAGIVYCHQTRRSIGEILRNLLLIHACFSQEEMQGHVEYI